MVLGPAWNGASISACRLADPVGYFTAYPLSRDHSGLSRTMGHVLMVANIGIFCPIGFSLLCCGGAGGGGNPLWLVFALLFY